MYDERNEEPEVWENGLPFYKIVNILVIHTKTVFAHGTTKLNTRSVVGNIFFHFALLASSVVGYKNKAQ